MDTPLELRSPSLQLERDVLDEALFCNERWFDPTELRVYLPPVPTVTPLAKIPIDYVVPGYFTPPLPDVEYSLSPCTPPDASTREGCGAVSDASGSYEMTNLAPGLYEVHPPASFVTPNCQSEEKPPPRPDLRVEVNEGLCVGPGEKGCIDSAVLRIGGAETPFPVDLMLLSPPMLGVLFRDGFALTGGDVFTLEDIEQGRISYRHEGDAVAGEDHFSFATTDGEILPTRVEIRIVTRRQAPRLLGGGRLDHVSEGVKVSTILDGRMAGDSGIAIVGIAGSGVWTYSLDDGQTWRSVTSIQPTLAMLLGPADRLRFVPRDGVSTSARLTYRAWDQSSHRAGERADLGKRHAVGGASAFSQEVTSASLRFERPIVPAKGQPIAPWEEPLIGADLIGGAVAIVRLAGAGTWQVAVGDSAWRDCKSVYHGRALLLGADDRLRFVPKAGATGKVSLSLRRWDGDGKGGGYANLAGRDSVGGDTGFGELVQSWSWIL